MTGNASFRRLILASVWLVICLGCGQQDARRRVNLWHQMTVKERSVLDQRIAAFEAAHPDIRIQALYKETEELRSGFQAAALAQAGPELVYGPSDSLGAFVTMGIVQDLRHAFSPEEQAQFLPDALTFVAPPPSDADADADATSDPAASDAATTAADQDTDADIDARTLGAPAEEWLVQVGDRVGNHLALVYNRKLIDQPPRTTEELIAFAKAATLDKNNDGTPDQYGLVWSFIEPFYFVPFLTGYEGWVFADDATTPSLDTPAAVAALNFVASLQRDHHVVPVNCDYETADTLFKDGKAAMIINGDWSWSDYLENTNIDAVVTTLPVVSETGKPMGPMVATKGYSLNIHAKGQQARDAIAFLRFMTSEETQRTYMKELKTLPSRKSLLDDPLLTSDPTLVASAKQVANGRAMPIVPELRAVWDGMRPPYQSLLNGSQNAEQAAAEMQAESIEFIRVMNQEIEPTIGATFLKILAGILTIGLLWWQRHAWTAFLTGWTENRMAYLMIGPAIIVLALTIVYPFFYNVVLSFSNMSLRNFQDWKVIGFQNYQQVLSNETFFFVLLKTFIWTFVCVFFHVTIGVFLAVVINGPVRGKSIYRLFLILPWAIPAYITALTWRGMFDYEYGAINLISTRWLHLPAVNWLGNEVGAFVSCILTNIWLGFPFMMVITLGGLQGIPGELYEAARMDRVSRWNQFRHITLPMLRPVLLPATTLGAIWTFNNLNVIWLVSNGGEPSDKTHILVSYVYKAVFNLYQYGYGAALSMLIFFLLLAFSLLFLNKTKATEGVA